MNSYSKILKLLLRNILRKNQDNKGKKWFWAAVIILVATYCMIVGMVSFFIIKMAPFIVAANIANETLTLLLGGGCLIVLVLGLVSLLSYLYFSKDTEFFLALPVKPSVIYAAKLTIVYLTELITTLLFFLPLLIVFGIAASMSAFFYVGALIAMLFLPAIPLVLASILAIPLMYIVGFFRNKGALTSIVVIVLFLAFFGGYYYLISQMQNFDGTAIDPSEIFVQYKAAMQSIMNGLYPIAAMVKFMTMTPVYGLGVGLSMLVNFLIFIGSVAVMGTIAVLISSAVYKRGAASQLEGAKNKKKENAQFVSSGKISALVKKEWKELIRTPAFSLQCLIGVVICPVAVLFMTLSFRSIPTEILGEELEKIKAMYNIMPIMIALMIGVCINVGASTTFTREGEMFFVLKTLPVTAKELVRAKSYIYLAISGLSVIVSMICYVVITKEFLIAFLGLVFLLIFDYGFVNFAMYFDLLRPKLDWKTPNEAVKNSRNAMIPLLIGMGVSMFLMIGSVMVTSLFVGWLTTLLLWGMLLIIATVIAVVFHKLLYTNAHNLLQRIG